MQIQEISHSEQQVILPQDFQQANNLIDSIQPRDSNPTKNKVKIFKNRVFQLLKIFVQKSVNVNTLIQSMKQQMFIRQPQKMKQLVTTILNKQNIKYENLQQLINFYQIVLLYKSHKKSSGQLNNISVDFVAILKKIALTHNQQAIQIVKNMFKSFAFQRKCTIKIHFFTYLFRKTIIQGLKKSIIQDCQLYLNDQKLRNAQKKQIIRVLENLDKNHQLVKKKNTNNAVKKQQNISQQQIQIVKRQNIEEQNQAKSQSKNKKQHTKQQLQKLQRIKANKKKRNKNPTQQKNNQNDKRKNNKSNNHSKNNKSKPQQRSQSKPQQRSQSKPQQRSQPSKPEFKGHQKPESRQDYQQKQIQNNQNRQSSKPHFKPRDNNNQARSNKNNSRPQNSNSKPNRSNQKQQRDNSRLREDKRTNFKPKFNKKNNNKRN